MKQLIIPTIILIKGDFLFDPEINKLIEENKLY